MVCKLWIRTTVCEKRENKRLTSTSVRLAATAAVLVSVVLFCLSACAIDITTQYEYDDLYRLTTVTFSAAVNGKPMRTLYTTTYVYDKNGNRIGMTKTACAPEIDLARETGRTEDTITVEVEGFGFQEGMEVTLILEDEIHITGTVTELTPTGAIVEFDYPEDSAEPVEVIVENPDGGTDTAPLLHFTPSTTLPGLVLLTLAIVVLFQLRRFSAIGTNKGG